MSLRAPAVVLLAVALVVSGAAVVVVSGSAAAECAAYMDTRPARMSDFAGYAFRATVTESSDDVGPALRGNTPFTWHVEMAVDEVYAGDVPDTVVTEGWGAGCASLRGDELRVGDRVVVMTRLLPVGPDDLRWRGHSLVWTATPRGWHLYRRAFNVSGIFASLPREARGYLTSGQLAALVSALPGTDTAPTAIPSRPAGSPEQMPSVDDHFGTWFQAVATRDPDGRALYVGDLDGPAHHVLTADSVQGTGPRDGRVLAWWRNGSRWVVELIEARSGARTELLRTRRPIAAAAFGLDDDWYYIVEHERGTSTRGLYRRRFAGGKAQRIADGWTGSGTSMYPSTDGATVAIASNDPDDGTRSYRLLDVERRRLTVLPGRTYTDIVGMLGEELVVWEDAPMGALQLPLRAIARDGTSRRIADQDGWVAAIHPAHDGTARLVYEGKDETGHHTLSVLEPGGSAGRVVYTGGPDSFDPPVQVVWRTQWMGIEVPGYMPVFPNAQVFLGDRLDTYGQLPRVLVPLDGGAPITLAPQPQVSTWGPMAVVHDPTRAALDAGNGPGTLVIGDTCTTLEVDGRATTLVWRDWQAAWDPRARTITFDGRMDGELVLASGDRLMLGGYAPWGGGSRRTAGTAMAGRARPRLPSAPVARALGDPGMRTRGLTSVVAACACVATALLVAPAVPASAECMGQVNRFPRYTDVAPSARTVVIGTVVQSRREDPAESTVVFTLRVDDVIRGQAPAAIEVEGIRSGLPRRGSQACRENAFLYVHLDDVIALALDGRLDGRAGINTAAWIEGRPDRDMTPGVQTLSRREATAAAHATPPTDTTPGTPGYPDMVSAARYVSGSSESSDAFWRSLMLGGHAPFWESIEETFANADLVVVGRPVSLHPGRPWEALPGPTVSAPLDGGWVDMTVAIEEVIDGAPVSTEPGVITIEWPAVRRGSREDTTATIPTHERSLFVLLDQAEIARRTGHLDEVGRYTGRYTAIDAPQSAIRDIDGLVQAVVPQEYPGFFPEPFEGEPFEWLLAAARVAGQR